MDTFSILHPKVQAFIYRQRWDHFRPIQDESIQHIHNKRGDLLICAPTASGKTEAAFFPIVSSIADDYMGAYRALYISPLKALINDQFKRVDQVCKEIGVPVTKWHGDVSQHLKTKSLNNPGGILLITPESLEAMLINKPHLAAKAFNDLRFIVIDEIHSFVGVERGAQLKSLLTRITKMAKLPPVKIALSATIGNPHDVAKWMSGASPCKIIVDKDWNDSSGVEGIIHGFTSQIPIEGEDLDSKESDGGFYEKIYRKFLNGKNLIFGNSKKRLEETAYIVKQIAQNQGSSTQFLIHHGSLAKETKEFAEEEIKESEKSTTIFCTSTLEMGIDIGAIEKVGIIDPPWSVSGFAQRIGRSGRREGTPKRFEFFVKQMEINEESNLSEILREDLVKSISIVQLYLTDFKEPLQIAKLHFSTLAHQMLSFCVQKSGATKIEIYETIIIDAFDCVLNEKQFEFFLDYLIGVGLLFLDGTGLYSAGSIGEKLIEHYEYYSVFQSSEQWIVIHDGQNVGEIPVIGTYKENDRILLGGRVWQIREVVERAKRLIVVPSRSAQAPVFSASFGITHKRIHEEMKVVYESDDEYPFLNSEALRLLNEGRKSYRDFLKSATKDNHRVPIFEGTVIQNTISCLLELLKIEHGISEICLEVSNPAWKKSLLELLSRFPNESALAALLPRAKKEMEKYDRFLPDDLLNSSYASCYLDITGAKAWIQNISTKEIT